MNTHIFIVVNRKTGEKLATIQLTDPQLIHAYNIPSDLIAIEIDANGQQMVTPELNTPSEEEH